MGRSTRVIKFSELPKDISWVMFQMHNLKDNKDPNSWLLYLSEKEFNKWAKELKKIGGKIGHLEDLVDCVLFTDLMYRYRKIVLDKLRRYHKYMTDLRHKGIKVV